MSSSADKEKASFSLSILTAKWFSWSLGIGVMVGYILWLVLPSRLPSLALLILVGVGAVARFWAGKQIKFAPHPKITQLSGNFEFSPSPQPSPIRGEGARGQAQGTAPAKLYFLSVRDFALATVRAEYFWLGIIMLVAISFRFAGIAQSLPYVDNPDEPTATLGAIKMLQTGDLNPHFFRWPSLIFYTQFLISVPTFLGGISSGQFNSLQTIVTDNFYLNGRLLSAFLGVATVGLVWLIGRKLYNSWVGLLGAFILAIMPLHAEHSRYVTPDIMVAFFAILTLLFAAYIYKNGERRWYLWAGVAAGLTTGTKYNVAIVLGLIILAHFLADRHIRGQLVWLWQSFGIFVLTFFLTTPFALFDLSGFLNELAFQIIHYGIEGHGGAASEGAAWSAYLRYLANEVFVGIALLVLAGAILTPLIRQKREDWLLLALPAVGYLFFSAAKTHFSRNLMPLLPPLALLSAVFLIAVGRFVIERLASKSRAKPILSRAEQSRAEPSPTIDEKNLTKKNLFGSVFVVLLAVLLFSFSIRNSFLTTRYNLQLDTRNIAGAWIVQNVPAGTKLRMEQGAPYLPSGRYREADQRRPIGGRSLDWYKAEGFDYLVAVSYQYRDLGGSNAEVAANYRSIFSEARLLKEFPGDSSEHPGPTIKIYAVK